MTYVEFDRIRLDALREISSIATGNAATSLSAILGERVDITVPNVMVEALENVPELLARLLPFCEGRKDHDLQRFTTF